MSPAQGSPNFRRLLAGASAGEKMVPIIRSALYDPNFRAFDVHIEGFSPRPPDGWFHPSTHPMVHERQLFYYLAEPDKQIPEVFDPNSTMAVTQGHFWHEFIQHVLLGVGALQRNPNPSPGRNAAEWFWKHERTRSRGHSDGLTQEEEIFEWKTMNSSRLRRIVEGPPDSLAVLDSFRKIAPEYFAQGQEYMRISGRRRWRAVLMAIEYPFPMREIVMDYDPLFAGSIGLKYERVLQAVEDGREPLPCCSGGAAAKVCPARAVCPIASLLP